ncbi:MAG: methyltransferase domain-containing protein [Caldilineaceae bacterium]|nr:methyltransferase domain-containing protein [Caldilineaceae bacterium]
MTQPKWAFYNQQYAKHGQYGGAQLVAAAQYPEGNPEEHFRAIVMGLGGPQKRVLDIGSGSGGFTLSLAPQYGQVVGVEPSDLMQKAQAQQQEMGIQNVVFERQDAFHTTFADQSFDVIYSRRGPNPRAEVDRLLRPDGDFVHITIGYDDARSLKDLFGRGQMFEKRGSSLDWRRQKLLERGYDICVLKEYGYDEYYATIDDLNAFLARVPIFEDYGLSGDADFLLRYAESNMTPQGIWLGRHRVLVHATKR